MAGYISAGEDFNIKKDNLILKINSPKDRLEGPFCVVAKDIDERWAIVAFNWDGNPSLGMRWFWGNGGNPFSSGHPTWCVIPEALTENIIPGLDIEEDKKDLISRFLKGHISGEELVKLL